MEIKDNELHWLAGLLEGEGSFMMSRNTVGGKVYYYPKIVVNMTDEDVISRAADLFGNSVYEIPRSKDPIRSEYKQQWRAQISGAKAAEIMRAILPVMGTRRSAKILEILDKYEDRQDSNLMRSESMKTVAARRERDDTGRFITTI